MSSRQSKQRRITNSDSIDTATIVNPQLYGPNGLLLSLPNGVDTLLGRSSTDTVTNKSLVDSSSFVVNSVDGTKKAKFSLTGVTTGTTANLVLSGNAPSIVFPSAS